MSFGCVVENTSVFSDCRYDSPGRTFGSLPGVSVWNSSDATTAPVFADRQCGERTKLIYYMAPGEMLSRTITSKDTHALRGDLVVVYSGDKHGGDAVEARKRATTSLLGFDTPSFSFGVDIVLPAEMNQQLRDVLASGEDGAGDPSKDDALVTRALSGVPNVHVPEVSYIRRAAE